MGIPTYTREMLVGPVAEASHMADLLRTLGVENTNGKRRAMWMRLRRMGIPTSHWERSPRRWDTDEALAAAAAQSTSYAGVLRLLGVPVTGGQHAHLARRIRQGGTATSHLPGPYSPPRQ